MDELELIAGALIACIVIVLITIAAIVWLPEPPDNTPDPLQQQRSMEIAIADAEISRLIGQAQQITRQIHLAEMRRDAPAQVKLKQNLKDTTSQINAVTTARNQI